jgi:chaperonin GroEL
VAFLYATRALDNVKPANDDQKVGVDIVRRALTAPVREIANNAGVDGALIVNTVLESDDTDFGYDAQNGEYVDLIKAGIIDPAKVMRLALQNAASVASLFITTQALVVEQADQRPMRGGEELAM